MAVVPAMLEMLILLHALVLTPASLLLLSEPRRDGSFPTFARFATVLQPGAAVALTVSFFLPAGVGAGTLTLPYLLLGLMVALHGLWRYFGRSRGLSGYFRPTELALDTGCLFFLVATVWLSASRFGLGLLGFSEPLVLLTAAHFHYAGWSASLITGLLGRILAAQKLGGPVYGVAAVGVIAAPILTALGITYSPLVEVVGAWLLAASLSLVAMLLVVSAAFVAVRRLARIFLLMAAAGVLMGMALAVLFSYGEYTGQELISIPDMVRTHGLINALLFCGMGTLAMLLLRPASLLPAAGAPFSRISAGYRRIDADFFDATGLTAASGSVPTGLCDDLSSYSGLDFEPQQVDPTVRRFYEHTADYDLDITPDWNVLFFPAARLYKLWSAWFGQMNFPLPGNKSEESMSSRILRLRDDRDGRSNVRAWVRAFAGSGRTLYVAAYSQHEHAGRTYMNIAFPFVGGNMTSILRLDNRQQLGDFARAGGLELTTTPELGQAGDQGVYFAIAGYGWRLPLNETIRVWPEAELILARHDMFLFGLHFLTLHYRISRSARVRKD